MQFRYDIQELRGFAVIFVILFHRKLLDGGFIGVDIFYVISGYLITFIISKENEANTFSISLFYKKRTVRIIPLFCFTIIMVIRILKYKNLCNKEFLNDALSCLMLFFNIKQSIKKESYFDAIYKTPFLHFWSLSVEQQFYLFCPSIVLFTRKVIIIPLSLALLMSLSCYIYYIYKKKNNSYYYSVCRFWEFLAGSLTSIIKHDSKCDIVAKNICILLIIISTFIFTNENRIILPFLIFTISIYIKITTVNDFICNNLIVFIGSISYSLYLLHYPIVVLVEKNIVDYILFLLVISIITYYCIEKNFNSINYFNFTIILWIFTLLHVLYYLEKIYIFKNKTPYIKLEEECMKDQTNMWCSHCHNIDKNIYKALFVGDSHVEQWIPALNDYLKIKRISIHHYYVHPNIVSEKKFKEFHLSHFKENESFVFSFVSFSLRKDWLSSRMQFDKQYPLFISYLLTISNYIIVIDDTPLLQPMNLCQECCKKQKCSSCFGIIGSNITIFPEIPNYNNNRVIHFNMNKYLCKNNICNCQIDDILVFEMWTHLFPKFVKTLSFAFNKLNYLKIPKYYINHYNYSCKYYMHGDLFLRSC